MVDFWLWTIIAAFFGIAEASILHQVSFQPDRTFKKPLDEHFYLGALRLVVCFAIFQEYPYFLVPMFCAFLTFPLMHDGFYYVFRNFWDRTIYQASFFDSSSTTDAWLSFPFSQRLFLFIVGMFGFIAYKTLFP